MTISAFETEGIKPPEPLPINVKQSLSPSSVYAKDTANPTQIVAQDTTDAMLIQAKDTAVPVKILATTTQEKPQPTPLGFVVVAGESQPIAQVETASEPKKPTPAQIWAEILHEVAEEEREAEKNKYLKVRKLEKTEPKTHLTTNFSISGLKPENK